MLLYNSCLIYGYKLGFCGKTSDSLGVGNFRRILGLVDAFTIGLSVSIIGGFGSLQDITATHFIMAIYIYIAS